MVMTTNSATEDAVMSVSELLPCPFCGGKGLVHNSPGSSRLWMVSCKNCDCGPHGKWSPADATAAWNRRSGTLPSGVKALEWEEIGSPAGDWWRAVNPLGGLDIQALSEAEKISKQEQFDRVIISCLSSAPPVEPVDGWVTVPKEPTEAMVKAAHDAHQSIVLPKITYAAMIDAAPQPTVTGVTEAMVDALKPFAKAAQTADKGAEPGDTSGKGLMQGAPDNYVIWRPGPTVSPVTMGDLRKARAALSSTTEVE